MSAVQRHLKYKSYVVVKHDKKSQIFIFQSVMREEINPFLSGFLCLLSETLLAKSVLVLQCFWHLLIALAANIVLKYESRTQTVKENLGDTKEQPTSYKKQKHSFNNKKKSL
jgi:hypothetical protein